MEMNSVLPLPSLIWLSLVTWTERSRTFRAFPASPERLPLGNFIHEDPPLVSFCSSFGSEISTTSLLSVSKLPVLTVLGELFSLAVAAAQHRV